MYIRVRVVYVYIIYIIYMYTHACIYASACVMKPYRGFSTSVLFVVSSINVQF